MVFIVCYGMGFECIIITVVIASSRNSETVMNE
jgi:hypothetical protein